MGWGEGGRLGTGRGAGKVAGIAETNLAVEGVKGAVAMTGDVRGWEIRAGLGTGASVTGSTVVVSSAMGLIASSFAGESLAAIITSSWLGSKKGEEGALEESEVA